MSYRQFYDDAYVILSMTEPPDKLNDYSLPAEFDVVSHKNVMLF